MRMQCFTTNLWGTEQAARKSIQLKWQEKNIASQAHLLALGVQQRKENGVAGVVGA